MHVRFEMSGGYGGLFAKEPLSAEVNSEDLPIDERAAFEVIALAALAAGSDFEQQAGTATDLMSYKLHIVDDEDSYDFDLDDLTVPPQTWPLIEYMNEAALRRRTENS